MGWPVGSSRVPCRTFPHPCLISLCLIRFRRGHGGICRGIKTVGQVLFYSSTLFLLMGALFGFLKDVMLWLRRRWGRSVPGGGGISGRRLLGGSPDFGPADVANGEGLVSHVPPPGSGLQSRPKTMPKPSRALYRRLLKWGAARGSPKGRHQTPGEYLETLRPLVPEKSRSLEMITECYIQVRYGPDPLAPGALDRIREDWRRLKARRKKRPFGPEHKI